MQNISRADVEDFLIAEAEMLDEWRLPEWLTLFTDDAKYEVPCTDLPPDASPDTNLFYIADDRVRLGERVKRLMKRTAHAEFPHSKTSRMVGNVRIRSRTESWLISSRSVPRTTGTLARRSRTSAQSWAEAIGTTTSASRPPYPSRATWQG